MSQRAERVHGHESREESSAIRYCRGAHCKAQSVMQGPRRAPQTRSTATALVLARSGKHNLGHANSPLGQAARTDA